MNIPLHYIFIYMYINVILGYWYALAVTLALEGIAILIIINLTNWNKQVEIVSMYFFSNIQYTDYN